MGANGRNGHDSSQERERLLRDHEGELAAFDLAGRNAMWRHKRLGVPVALWEDGKVVEIQPEDIPEEWCEKPERLAFPF